MFYPLMDTPFPLAAIVKCAVSTPSASQAGDNAPERPNSLKTLAAVSYLYKDVTIADVIIGGPAPHILLASRNAPLWEVATDAASLL